MRFFIERTASHHLLLRFYNTHAIGRQIENLSDHLAASHLRRGWNSVLGGGDCEEVFNQTAERLESVQLLIERGTRARPILEHEHLQHSAGRSQKQQKQQQMKQQMKQQKQRTRKQRRRLSVVPRVAK